MSGTDVAIDGPTNNTTEEEEEEAVEDDDGDINFGSPRGPIIGVMIGLVVCGTMSGVYCLGLKPKEDGTNSETGGTSNDSEETDSDNDGQGGEEGEWSGVSSSSSPISPMFLG